MKRLLRFQRYLLLLLLFTLHQSLKQTFGIKYLQIWRKKNAKPPWLRFGPPVESASKVTAVGNGLITLEMRWSPEPELLCTLEKYLVLEKNQNPESPEWSLPAAEVFFFLTEGWLYLFRPWESRESVSDLWTIPGRLRGNASKNWDNPFICACQGHFKEPPNCSSRSVGQVHFFSCLFSSFTSLLRPEIPRRYEWKWDYGISELGTALSSPFPSLFLVGAQGGPVEPPPFPPGENNIPRSS